MLKKWAFPLQVIPVSCAWTGRTWFEW